MKWPAPSHYLNQWWLSLMTHICVTRPQWVKSCKLMNYNASPCFVTYPLQENKMAVMASQHSGLQWTASMMMWWHEKDSCITGPLWGESNGDWWVTCGYLPIGKPFFNCYTKLGTTIDYPELSCESELWSVLFVSLNSYLYSTIVIALLHSILLTVL